MATAYHNLSEYDPNTLPSSKGMKVSIVVSEWNSNITFSLRDGAIKAMLDNGARKEDIRIYYVPGSFELTYAAAQLAKHEDIDAVIVLGSVIKGETPHFDFVCQGVTEGITRLNTEQDTPIIFGLLTTFDMPQAEARSGGILGNKGIECAIAAIKMIDFIWNLKK
jgi:6,7-dimethyl-8-ribityllumazine synthase